MSLHVLAAAYDDRADALAEYESIKAAYAHVGVTHAFDAAVVAKEDGEVKIVRRHDEPTRHGTDSGLGWGLAAGAVAALLPGVGILGALALGGGAGAALGRAAGHAASVMTRDDLKELGEVLDEGDAGLVVVYGSDMADRVITSVSRARRTVRRSTDVSLAELAAQVRGAQASDPTVRS